MNMVISKENSTYIVTLHTEIGQFVGKAKCSPEDKDIENEDFGYLLASYRAKVKYLVAKKKIVEIKYKECVNLWKLFCSSSKMGPSPREARIINNQIDSYIEEERKYQEEIMTKKFLISHMILNNREEIEKKFERSKKS